MVRLSIQKYYFGVYYTGMAQEGTGNWVVLPDDESEKEVDVALITL